MKLWLDDERPEPDSSWATVKTASKAIEALKCGGVSEISLDHDLGAPENGTGYDVILWIEEQVIVHKAVPPRISIHTANPIGRQRMEMSLANILKHSSHQEDTP